MKAAPFSATQVVLFSAILLVFGGMACPNAPWNPAARRHELSLLHGAEQEPAPAELLAGVETSLAMLSASITAADGKPATGISLHVTPVGSRKPCYEGISDARGTCTAEIAVPANAEEFVVEWLGPLGRMTTRVERIELAGLSLPLSRP